MQNKALRFGPQYLASSAANILNPPTTTSGVINGGANFVGSVYAACRIILRHIRVVNTDTVDRTVTLFVGGSGGSTGGTEFAWMATVVPANSYIDWYGYMPLDVADFLTGLASAGSVVTIQGEGEIVVA